MRGPYRGRGRSGGKQVNTSEPGELCLDEGVQGSDVEDDGDGPDKQELALVPDLPGNPLILSRDKHSISRREIDDDALKVMRRLIRYGYKAFLVGGGVRDLLLGKQPKDFDIGTDAEPETVRALFRNSRIIGRRFRINHVYFRGNKIIEVSTFRQPAVVDEDEEVQTLLSDNTFGDPETDAVRRDLTINGLFYDLSTFSVIDYVGGIEDLKAGIIRIIGDPDTRFREDPVRMIRAIRHAARAGFQVEPATYGSICRNKELIKLCPPARVYEEFIRELRGGNSLASLELLDKTGLLPYLLPVLNASLRENRDRTWNRLREVLSAIDEEARRHKEELPVAALLPALLIGNVPTLKEDAPAEQAALLEYWDAEIAPVSDEEELDTSGMVPTIEPIAVGRGRRRRGTPGRLAGMITRFFEEVGVSRKDRERIEQLISSRYYLLKSQDEGALRQAMQRSYAGELALLLRITARDSGTRRLLEKIEGMRTKREDDASQKRRRGRRRRRRGPRGRAESQEN